MERVLYTCNHGRTILEREQDTSAWCWDSDLREEGDAKVTLVEPKKVNFDGAVAVYPNEVLSID